MTNPAIASEHTHILIVDDHVDNLRSLAAILQVKGYKVRKATSGAIALTSAKTHPPDIILLDVRMPEMDGYAVCKHLRQEPATADIPIIFLSALHDGADKVKAFECGGADYITKPFQANEVLARIHHQLVIRQQQQQLKQQNQQLQLEISKREVLGSMISHIRQSLDLNEVLSIAVGEVRELLQVERVFIGQFDAQGHVTVLAAATAATAGSIAPERLNDPASLAYWRSLSTTQTPSSIGPECDRATAPEPALQTALLAQWHMQASLICPIWIEGQPWGWLAAQHCTTAQPWENWMVDYLQQLSEQLAIAIHQSALYSQVQALNTNLETQVTERTQQLQQALDFETTLKRITDKVRDSLDEHHILQAVLHELALALGETQCQPALSLYVHDGSTTRLRYQATASTSPAAPDLILDLTNVPDLHHQLQQGHAIAFCYCGPQTIEPPAAILACPIRAEKQILGYVWLSKPLAHTFAEQEIRLACQVANQCAIALRQAYLYQASQHQLEAMQRLEQLKDDFLSTISHELRTPIASIRMVMQLLATLIIPYQDTLPPASANKISEYLQILEQECDRELTLVQGLLDLQHLRADTSPLQTTAIALSLWLAHILEPFELQTQRRQQTLHIHIPPNLPTLNTDIYRLNRLLTELLSNACKHSPDGAAIGVTATATATTIQIVVENSGIEIPATEVTKIFNPFYRIPSNDPWKEGGTGIGLALAQRLAAYLNSALHVESAQNTTRFILDLPLR